MRLDFCAACGNRENLSQHHLVPRSRGGSDLETNLLTLCDTCHGLVHEDNTIFELRRLGFARMKASGRRTGPRTLEQRGKLVLMASELHAKGYSFEHIGQELAKCGYFNRGGKPYPGNSVKRMLRDSRPASQETPVKPPKVKPLKPDLNRTFLPPFRPF